MPKGFAVQADRVGLRVSVPPNGPGIELPAARDLTVVNRRPPACVAYRCGRPAAGAPPRTPGRRPVSSNALLGRAYSKMANGTGASRGPRGKGPRGMVATGSGNGHRIVKCAAAISASRGWRGWWNRNNAHPPSDDSLFHLAVLRAA